MRKPDWKLWLKDEKECEFWLDSYIRKNILKKSSNESRLHLRRTDHNLTFANWIIEKHKDEIPTVFGGDNFYDWVISIYYYAIYHAALALMSKEGFTSKNHSATLAFLIYHHYHSQKALEKEDVELIASSLDREDIETLGISKELREKACYDVHEQFEKKLAEQIREQTVDFANKIKLLLQ
ncbi:MAG: HEPN domain-containing protein [Nanoarchaeota archaeon]|mgnify:FL=1